MSKRVKIFVIAVGIIAVLIFVFSHVGNSAAPANDASLTSTAGKSAALPGGGGTVVPIDSSSSFSALLSSINSINLDTSIFSNPGYLALRNNIVDLGTAIIGRQNPFAPIGTDTAVQQQGSLQVQTLAAGKVLSTSAEFGALITATSLAPTTVVFQYGTSDTLGNASSPVIVSKNGTALFTVTGLTPATTYYVEAVAVQGSTTTTGTIMSFTTSAAGQ